MQQSQSLSLVEFVVTWSMTDKRTLSGVVTIDLKTLVLNKLDILGRLSSKDSRIKLIASTSAGPLSGARAADFSASVWWMTIFGGPSNLFC